MWQRQQDRAAISIDFNLGRAGLARFETDNFHSLHLLPMPPFRAYFVTSNQAVKPNRHAGLRYVELANIARPHPRRELCIAMLINK